MDADELTTVPYMPVSCSLSNSLPRLLEGPGQDRLLVRHNSVRVAAMRPIYRDLYSPMIGTR